jgi:hypothetical protein
MARPRLLRELTGSCEDRRRGADVDGSSGASSADVTVVYVTMGLIKAKNNMTRNRMRKTGKVK